MNTTLEALGLVFQTEVIVVIFLSAIYGMVVGALPGLTATMATALLVPVTFYLSPIAAIAAIITSSAMAIFSGDIPGALLRIPGTPASAAKPTRPMRSRARASPNWRLESASGSVRSAAFSARLR
jgi:TctA family transporter